MNTPTNGAREGDGQRKHDESEHGYKVEPPEIFGEEAEHRVRYAGEPFVEGNSPDRHDRAQHEGDEENRILELVSVHEPSHHAP